MTPMTFRGDAAVQSYSACIMGVIMSQTKQKYKILIERLALQSMQDSGSKICCLFFFIFVDMKNTRNKKGKARLNV